MTAPKNGWGKIDQSKLAREEDLAALRLLNYLLTTSKKTTPVGINVDCLVQKQIF